VSVTEEGVTGDQVGIKFGSDEVVITVPQGASDEEFKRAILLLGLEGHTDYEIDYDPDTGIETYRIPDVIDLTTPHSSGLVMPLIPAAAIGGVVEAALALSGDGFIGTVVNAMLRYVSG
jgi:hypothetical protein